MGCTASISAVSLALPSNPHGFTDQQKRLVLRTWKILSNDLNGRGTRIFLRIFRLHPEVKKLFPCGHLDGDALVKDIVFKGHANRFMQSVGAVMDNIDNYEKALSPLLNSLGRQHIFYRGFKYDYFDAFEEAMMYVWAEDLGAKFTEDTRLAWHGVFNFVMNELKQGYTDALKDAGLTSAPGRVAGDTKDDAQRSTDGTATVSTMVDEENDNLSEITA